MAARILHLLVLMAFVSGAVRAETTSTAVTTGTVETSATVATTATVTAAATSSAVTAETTPTVFAGDWLPGVPVAFYAGTTLTLPMLETFARELPAELSEPLFESGLWRVETARALAARDLLASAALQRGADREAAFTEARRHFEDDFLTYLILRSAVTDRVSVPDSEVAAFYESHPQDFGCTSALYLRIMRTRSLAKAAQAQKRLAKGEKLEDVEKDLSEMSARTRGRVLGPFPNPDSAVRERIPDELFRLANALEPGRCSAPIYLSGCYYIVELDKREARTPVDLASVRERIRGWIAAERSRDLETEFVNKLKGSAKATSGGTTNSATKDGASRTALLVQSARDAGLDHSEEFRAAAALFELQQLSESELQRAVAGRLSEPTDDQVTSYLRALHAVPGKDGFSANQKDIARGRLHDEARRFAENDVFDDLLTSAGFRMADSSGIEGLPPTAVEAAEIAAACLQDTSTTLHVQAVVNSSTSEPLCFIKPHVTEETSGGLSHRVAGTSVPLLASGRGLAWIVDMADDAGRSVQVDVRGRQARLARP